MAHMNNLSISRITKATLLALGLSLGSNAAIARDLVEDLQKALKFDPTYQGALAEFAAGQKGVKQARSVFFPEATFGTQRLATDTSARTTFTITQPLLDYERWLTLDQAAPKQLLAEVGLRGKKQDLALRLFKASNAIVLANENIKLNEAKIAAVNQQAERARRLLQGGQGTITDLRDIEVKASQAKAQQLAFKTQQQISLKQYEAIVGELPKASEFVLPTVHGKYNLLPMQQYAQLALQGGPNVLSARYSLQIAEFEVKKIKASFLPVMTAQYQYSKNAGNVVSNSYVGLGLSIPLKAGTWYNVETAQANVLRAQENIRETESKVRLEADRLSALSESGLEALRIQGEAIAAAELSVEANTKSYQGGVRTAVDVLNAIQTSFQVKSDYVSLATTQAENILSLILLAAVEPQDAVAEAYKYLFAK